MTTRRSSLPAGSGAVDEEDREARVRPPARPRGGEAGGEGPVGVAGARSLDVASEPTPPAGAQPPSGSARAPRGPGTPAGPSPPPPPPPAPPAPSPPHAPRALA